MQIHLVLALQLLLFVSCQSDSIGGIDAELAQPPAENVNWWDSLKERFAPSYPRVQIGSNSAFTYPAESSPWFDRPGFHSFRLNLDDSLDISDDEQITVALYWRKWIGNSAFIKSVAADAATVRNWLVEMELNDIDLVAEDRTVYLVAFRGDSMHNRDRIAASAHFSLLHVSTGGEEGAAQVAMSMPRQFFSSITFEVVNAFGNKASSANVKTSQLDDGKVSISVDRPLRGWYYVRASRKNWWRRRKSVAQSAPMYFFESGEELALNYYPSKILAGGHLILAVDNLNVAWAGALLAFGVPIDIDDGIVLTAALSYNEKKLQDLPKLLLMVKFLGNHQAFMSSAALELNLLQQCVLFDSLVLLQTVSSFLFTSTDATDEQQEQIYGAYIYAIQLERLLMVDFIGQHLVRDVNYDDGKALRVATSLGNLELLLLVLKMDDIDVHVDSDQAFINAVSIYDVRPFMALISYDLPAHQTREQIAAIIPVQDRVNYLEILFGPKFDDNSDRAKLLHIAFESAVLSSAVKCLEYIVTKQKGIENLNNGEPLMLAIRNNQLESVEFLVAHSANIKFEHVVKATSLCTGVGEKMDNEEISQRLEVLSVLSHTQFVKDIFLPQIAIEFAQTDGLDNAQIQYWEDLHLNVDQLRNLIFYLRNMHGKFLKHRDLRSFLIAKMVEMGMVDELKALPLNVNDMKVLLLDMDSLTRAEIQDLLLIRMIELDMTDEILKCAVDFKLDNHRYKVWSGIAKRMGRDNIKSALIDKGGIYDAGEHAAEVFNVAKGAAGHVKELAEEFVGKFWPQIIHKHQTSPMTV